MVKGDLVQDLVKAFPGITKQDMTAVVDTLFESVAQALMRGEAVDVRDMGRLRVKERAPKKGRNPKTGASVEVPTRWEVHFKPATGLTNRINH
jgi:integration host factor subunit beta